MYSSNSTEGLACNRVVKVRWHDGNTAETIRNNTANANEYATISFEKNKTYLVTWSDRHYLADKKEGMTIDGNGATIKIADGTNKSDFTWGSLFRVSRKTLPSRTYLLILMVKIIQFSRKIIIYIGREMVSL